MDKNKRLRRVGLLCCHFVRNYAYYQASWDEKGTKATNEFWATIQGNFIDIAVLEWLKLFGDHKDKHHWKNIVKDKENFKKGMFATCNISETELADCRQSLKEYRDKFVAHLDSDEIMHIPVLKIPFCLTKYYYQYIVNELVNSELGKLPKDISKYHKQCLNDSLVQFCG